MRLLEANPHPLTTTTPSFKPDDGKKQEKHPAYGLPSQLQADAGNDFFNTIKLKADIRSSAIVYLFLSTMQPVSLPLRLVSVDPELPFSNHSEEY
jgi:hypothetical protein